MPIRALVFDFDGLIIDTETTDFQAWHEVYAAHGCELSLEVWADCVGRPAGHFDPLEHLAQLAKVPIDRERVQERRRARLRALNAMLTLLPGVLDYLRDARALGLQVGVASSSDRGWVEGHLIRLGLREYFAALKCSEDTATHKPDPAPYLAVLDALGVAPREAVAFEDSPHGVAAAKAAGMWCVAVPNPITRQFRLDRADHIAESLASMPLRAWLSRFDGGVPR